MEAVAFGADGGRGFSLEGGEAYAVLVEALRKSEATETAVDNEDVRVDRSKLAGLMGSEM